MVGIEQTVLETLLLFNSRSGKLPQCLLFAAFLSPLRSHTTPTVMATGRRLSSGVTTDQLQVADDVHVAGHLEQDAVDEA